VLASLNLSRNDLTCHGNDLSGIFALVAAFRNTKMLCSVNLLGNKIAPAHVEELVKVKATSASIRTLCGITGEEIELDLSSSGLSVGCAVMLSYEIRDHPALTKLDISNNQIGYGGNLDGSVALGKALEANM
jgi:hypothetical protein